jgi:hypothetical protein
MPKRKAIDLKAGDEFEYRDEPYRVTVNEEFNGERKIWTYAVHRPRTAPFIIFWPNDHEVEITKEINNGN